MGEQDPVNRFSVALPTTAEQYLVALIDHQLLGQHCLSIIFVRRIGEDGERNGLRHEEGKRTEEGGRNGRGWGG